MKFENTERTGVVETFGLVKSCEKKSAKNGTFYLDMVVADKDSELTVKLWDYKEENVPMPVVNSIIKMRGTLQQYNGADQFILQRCRTALDSDNIKVSDFVKSAEYSGSKMFDELRGIAADFADTDLANVVTAMLDDNRDRLVFYPAAEKLHHAMNGGLLYHTLSIVRLAEAVSAVYPCIDRELLLAGAILHDVAKLREYTVNAAGMVDGHTLEGMLLGHLVMGAEDVGRACDKLGVPAEKKYLLQHMLVSHHGKLEFGAAVRPSFIEAEVLSQLDLFDANIYEMADAVKEVNEGDFTGRLWMLDNRKFLNHGRKNVYPEAELFEKEEND